jgi:type I restriction enzyme S subunit
LSARNIKNGYLSLDDVDYIPEKELRRIQKRCNPQAGDILISCSGTIGNVCIVPDGFIGGMVRSAALVKLNSDKIESQFAELLILSHYLQNQMKVAVASSVQGNIFQGAIKKLRMFYPHDKQERLAITERLYLFNKEIASMQDKIIVLERLKKSLMQNLLTGKTKMNVLIWYLILKKYQRPIGERDYKIRSNYLRGTFCLSSDIELCKIQTEGQMARKIWL